MRFNLTVLPGDGVGPEVTREALRVLLALSQFSDCEFVCQEQAMGGAAIRAHGTPPPPGKHAGCSMNSDAVSSGAVGAPEYDHLSTQKSQKQDCLVCGRRLVALPTCVPWFHLRRLRIALR